MEEQNFLRFALLISLLGVFILFLCTSFFHYDLKAIQDISTDMDGKIVRVQGKILSSRNVAETYILTLQDDTGSIPVVLYTAKEIDFRKGSYVEVVGTVDEYECSLEIKADEILFL
ncbi:hypothetical protein EXS74_02525 [Candidatus Woesearchaeota archaeon]|nr:hypothetical protein [Candidatus Woesearchaeota archaeon]